MSEDKVESSEKCYSSTNESHGLSLEEQTKLLSFVCERFTEDDHSGCAWCPLDVTNIYVEDDDGRCPFDDDPSAWKRFLTHRKIGKRIGLTYKEQAYLLCDLCLRDCCPLRIIGLSFCPVGQKCSTIAYTDWVRALRKIRIIG